MTGRVVVVGSFNQDHVWTGSQLPAPGQTVSGRYASGPGGKGFNQAIAARRAGAETRLVCALGHDGAAELALALARADGLVLHAERVEAATGCAAVVVDGEGRNQIVVAPGANAALSHAHVLAQADAIERAGVVLAQVEVAPSAVAAALHHARRNGIVTVLNPAPADAEIDRELLTLADILTPNETEFCALLARHAGLDLAPDDIAGLADDRLAELCRRLSAGTVVITLGRHGCLISHGQHRHGDAQAVYRLGPEPVRAIDTTGAGDAFNGALAAALAQHPERPFVHAARFANRYAALSTERPGAALAMPTRSEFEARYPG
ncbi:MAG TPA: ribokinase [Xanthomonadales bacterium]|nr:ribokinase [Xanthomonadales bacterium]